MAKRKEPPEETVETTMDLNGTEDFDYDQWLEFFRKLPGGAFALINGIDYIQMHANPDGYAAARRWLEIFENPSKMDKLYKGRLDKQNEESIMDIAIGDDDEKFYIALIQQNTSQLNSSSISQQEVARLSENINIFRKELKEIRSRKPKAGSVLDKVLKAAENPIVKKPVGKTAIKKTVTRKPAKRVVKKVPVKKSATKKPIKTTRGKNNGK